MPGPELLLSFLAATLVFAYMPGPSTLYAAAQTLAAGRRHGWLSAAGLHLGGYVHVALATLGLAAVFESIPTLYLVFKFAGAAYLIWLGVAFLQGGPTRQRQDHESRPASPRTRNPLRDSIVVEVLNPKTALFYLAFLPQFCDPLAAWPIWAQMLTLGVIVNVLFSTADALCVVAADRLLSLFGRSARAGRLAHRVGGTVLVGLGVNMALIQR